MEVGTATERGGQRDGQRALRDPGNGQAVIRMGDTAYAVSYDMCQDAGSGKLILDNFIVYLLDKGGKQRVIPGEELLHTLRNIAWQKLTAPLGRRGNHETNYERE